jgi:hypothetical protein
LERQFHGNSISQLFEIVNPKNERRALLPLPPEVGSLRNAESMSRESRQFGVVIYAIKASMCHSCPLRVEVAEFQPI